VSSARIVTSLLGAALTSALALSTVVALGLGEHDVATVFYVSKSDDRNRVDYGVRLDEACRPSRDEPIFAYWRRFEPGEPRFGELNLFDQQAYGITSQRVASCDQRGSWIELGIRAIPDRMLVRVEPGPDGDGCVARARMELNGRLAWVDHAHVQLAGPMAVRSITFYGTDVHTGDSVRERRTR